MMTEFVANELFRAVGCGLCYGAQAKQERENDA